MEYTITPSRDGKYIIIKTIGEINGQSAMKQNIEAHALGKKLGINRYLVDGTESRNVDSITGNYKFAYNDMLHTPEIDTSAIVAILVNPDDHSHDFVETVSRNSGMNVTIFRDRDEAIKHLMNE